jgi:hypothetical protein
MPVTEMMRLVVQNSRMALPIHVSMGIPARRQVSTLVGL